MTLDVLVRGGRVIDGSGAPATVADVAIEGDRIVAVEPLPHATARTVIDATGLAVTPGFVDLHSHGDITLLADPRARSAIAQGVTSVVVGNCGHSPAPLPDPSVLGDLVFGSSDGVSITWTGLAGYLDALAEARPAVNVATLAGHGAIRLATLGRTPRAATGEEVDAMVRALDQAIDEGAIGVSVGLEYPHGTSAGTDELVALARATATRDGLFAIHTRDRDLEAAAAFDEAFAIAEQAGVALQISHLAPRHGAPAGTLPDVLARIDRARAAGLDIACDQHTRLHGITKLVTMLPPEALAGGTAELRRQLQDPAARAAFRAFRKPIHKAGLMGEWERLTLFEAPHSPAWVGKDFAWIGRERGQDPFDALLDLLLEAGDEAPEVLFVGLVQTQQDLDLAFGSATCVPESDATILSPDGPTAAQRFLGAYTWAAWYLRCIVRERRIVSLEEGIRQLTALPAARAGLVGRGVLAPGAWADVVVLDPERIHDRGTLEAPNTLAEGISHVVVNGRVAMDDGRFADARAGRVLRGRGAG